MPPKKPKRTPEQTARLRQFDAMLRAFKRVQMRVGAVTINNAIKKDRGNISSILSHGDINRIKQELNHYFRATSPVIWRNALKQVWLDAGAASIELHHSFFTGTKSSTYDDELDIEQKDWWDSEADEWAPLPEFDFFTNVTKAADPPDTWAQSVDDYLRGNGAGRADGISSTTGDQVMNAIADGVAAGEPTRDVAARVESQLDETWPGRADTIARTETAAATNQASLEDAKATVPGMNKTWICSFVNSREWHQDADGQSVPLEEPFIVMEEELDVPGDPSGEPENVINCMCSVGYESPSGEEVGEGEEAAAPELTDEQTAQLADMFDQLAAGEGELTPEEGTNIADGISSIMGTSAEGAPETYTDYKDAYNAFQQYADDTLTKDERKLVTDYTIREFQPINYFLRYGGKAGWGPDLTADIEAEANSMVGIIQNAPQFEGTVYRAVWTPYISDFYTQLQSAQVGDELSFAGITSTSAEPDTMGNILEAMKQSGVTGNNQIYYTIEDAKGAVIQPLSGMPQENLNEVVLNDGVKGEITNIKEVQDVEGRTQWPNHPSNWKDKLYITVKML
jgi:hypothetical protein